MIVLLKVKTLVFVVTLLFAVYCAWQAVTIAGVGVSDHIPQLIGDGGGAVLFAALVAAGGLTSLLRPSAAVSLFALALATGVVTALVYQDLMLWFWSGAATLLGALSVVNARREKRRRGAVAHPSYDYEAQ